MTLVLLRVTRQTMTFVKPLFPTSPLRMTLRMMMMRTLPLQYLHTEPPFLWWKDQNLPCLLVTKIHSFIRIIRHLLRTKGKIMIFTWKYTISPNFHSSSRRNRCRFILDEVWRVFLEFKHSVEILRIFLLLKFYVKPILVNQNLDLEPKKRFSLNSSFWTLLLANNDRT